MWYDLKEYHYQNIWITYWEWEECWGGWRRCYVGCGGGRSTRCYGRETLALF